MHAPNLNMPFASNTPNSPSPQLAPSPALVVSSNQGSPALAPVGEANANDAAEAVKEEARVGCYVFEFESGSGFCLHLAIRGLESDGFNTTTP